MSDDIVDFSPGPGQRRALRPRPTLLTLLTGGTAVPLAGLGAALAAASLVGQWQTVTMPESGPVGPSFASPVSALGAMGMAYLVAVIILVAVAALALFGDDQVRRAARVAGIALSGSTLVLLGATANTLTTTAGLVDFRFYPAELMDDVTITLEWGLFAAMGAVAALGAALLLHRPAVVPEEPVEEPEYEPGDAIDLTVTVEPIHKSARYASERD